MELQAWERGHRSMSRCLQSSPPLLLLARMEPSLSNRTFNFGRAIKTNALRARANTIEWRDPTIRSGLRYEVT